MSKTFAEELEIILAKLDCFDAKTAKGKAGRKALLKLVEEHIIGADVDPAYKGAAQRLQESVGRELTNKEMDLFSRVCSVVNDVTAKQRQRLYEGVEE